MSTTIRHRNTRTAGRAADRRGVLILVVLSMLVLFMLLALTFVMVTGQHRRSLRAASRQEQYGNDYAHQMDEAMHQLVRDTTNPNSALLEQSLLNDLYGNDAVTGTITAATPVTGGGNATQLIDLTVTPAVPPPTSSPPSGTWFWNWGTLSWSSSPTPPPPGTVIWNPLAGYYNGCVLTPTSGNLAGHSTRVVGSGVNSGSYIVRVLAFDNDTTVGPASGDLFRINGRPFNGTGFGYDYAAKKNLTYWDTGLMQWTGAWTPLAGMPAKPYAALMPNRPAYLSGYDGISGNTDDPYEPASTPGGNPSLYVVPITASPTASGYSEAADEDYDAPDVQNMFLASVPPGAVAFGNPGTTVTPSFHRPELVQYWMSQIPGAMNWYDLPGELLQRTLLRPIPIYAKNDPTGTHQPRFLDSRPAINTEFTGSNSAAVPGNPPYATFPIKGPWDVDNDGDGVADSVWVDIGMPWQTGPNGKQYKPLFAFLCVDLDGRLNVNAHGSLADIDAYQTSFSSSNAKNLPWAGWPSIGTSAPTPSIFGPDYGFGSGYGPADINLLGLFTAGGGGIPNYKNLLLGDPSGIYPGRYGMKNGAAVYPGQDGVFDPLAAIKWFDYPLPGTYDNPLPGSYGFTVPQASAFSTAPDLWGYGFVGLDIRGMPLMTGTGAIGRQSVPTGSANDTLDSPYELNLGRTSVRDPAASSSTAVDNPFTPGELERILRIYDMDSAALPDRLRAFLNVTPANIGALRNDITTDSYDLPCPSIVVPPGLQSMVNNYRSAMGYSGYSTATNLSVADLLGAVLYNNGSGITTLQSSTLQVDIATEAQKMLGPELMAGKRLDINRALGNGRDDATTNGVVDEPTETETSIWNSTSAPPSFTPPSYPIAPNCTNSTPGAVPRFPVAPNRGTTYDANSDTVPDMTDQAGPRQILARNLYVLMMLLLIDPATNKPVKLGYDENGDGNIDEVDTAYAVAQWAINVVDYRDRDSIMTPFEFDIYPFNGWNVDGNPFTNTNGTTDLMSERGVVWGCERPELLISETLAFHDRRTEDLASESPTNPAEPDDHTPGRTTDPHGVNWDATYDQRLRPIGAFFVELYNPWVTSKTVATGQPSRTEVPGEFYTLSTTTDAATGVNLTAVDPVGGYPVWRLIITKDAPDANGERKDPDHPNPVLRPTASNPALATDDVERSIYFTAPPALGIPGQGLIAYSPPVGVQIAPLLPGRYAVVGSGVPDGGGNYITPIGRPKSVTGVTPTPANYLANQYRAIVLTPGSSTSTQQVHVYDNNNIDTVTYPVNPPDLPQPPDIQDAIAVPITTPRSVSISEPVNGYFALDPGGDVAMPTVEDTPVDPAPMASNGTVANYRTVHLQRLADPTRAWNANTNPYLTVDSMAVDLTSFNGVTDDSGDPNAGGLDPNGLATFERGHQDTTYPPASPPTGPQFGLINDLWRHELPNTSTTVTHASSQTNVTPQFYQYNLVHTLGLLNTNYGPRLASGNSYGTAYSGSQDPASKPPFPWLNWNDRPYSSAMELISAPRSRSSRVLYDFNPALFDPTANATGPYKALAGNTSPPTPRGHLMNFFQAKPWPPTPPNNTPPAFHRLLDYVEVPSRFVGTETWLPPTPASSALTGAASEQQLASYLHPPFNKVSNYRDPGRVNINTIADATVGAGVGNGLTLSLNFGPFQISRAGMVPPTLPTPWPYPSLMMNPFRSSAGASLMLPSSPSGGAAPSTPTNQNTPTTYPLSFANGEVDATLLRSTSTFNGLSVSTTPLFSYTSSGSAYDDPTRNPYFRFQVLNKLSNVVTTRSNVYAVWVTMGYFERASDGSGLGQEMGSDSGEVQRHRAFYIYDRTIPVCFEPGKNDNVDKGFLLRRIIE